MKEGEIEKMEKETRKGTEDARVRHKMKTCLYGLCSKLAKRPN
jgi:hypothetical protein